uniref:Transporter-related n=1 Tax=Musa acuminata TaxID=4641 RepID=Q1EPD3_MUSAC|nr:transporter-related [Musa acuminata]
MMLIDITNNILSITGHLDTLLLAAVSVVQNNVEGFAYGILLGMGSDLETLYGQAESAGQLHILGIYMQRSWIITLVTATALTPLYVFTAPILKLLHQPDDTSDRRVWVMTVIAGVNLGIHILLNWIFVVELGHGVTAAAMVENVLWWLINLAQMVYLLSGYFPDSWTGFSLLPFQNLSSASVKLSIASAIMNAMLGALVQHCSDHSSGLLEKPRYGGCCHFYLVCCSSLTEEEGGGGGLLGRLRGLPFKKGGTRKQTVAVIVVVASYVIKEFI